MDKILQVQVEADLMLNGIKTSLKLLEIAKEAGYTKVELEFVGMPPELLPEEAKGAHDIDGEIKLQKEYIEFYNAGCLNL